MVVPNLRLPNLRWIQLWLSLPSQNGPVTPFFNFSKRWLLIVVGFLRHFDTFRRILWWQKLAEQRYDHYTVLMLWICAHADPGQPDLKSDVWGLWSCEYAGCYVPFFGRDVMPRRRHIGLGLLVKCFEVTNLRCKFEDDIWVELLSMHYNIKRPAGGIDGSSNCLGLWLCAAGWRQYIEIWFATGHSFEGLPLWSC